MTAYGDNPEYHRIINQKFVCTAPPEAPCRTLPTCDCDVWCGCDGSPEAAQSHLDEYDDDREPHCCSLNKKPGQPCWIASWIEPGDDLEESFSGDPDEVFKDGEWAWPDGGVTVEFEDEDYGCTWQYAFLAIYMHDPDQDMLPFYETAD